MFAQQCSEIANDCFPHLDDEQLPQVEEDGVDLDHEGEAGVGEELVAACCDAEAGDDAGVVEEKLVGAALRVVQRHVEEVVHEVSDGEAHQHVRQVAVAVDHVLLRKESVGEES